jgi:hypothetical protein
VATATHAIVCHFTCYMQTLIDELLCFSNFVYMCIYVHIQGKQVVGLERGPLSLVSTTEELLDRKVAAPV